MCGFPLFSENYHGQLDTKNIQSRLRSLIPGLVACITPAARFHAVFLGHRWIFEHFRRRQSAGLAKKRSKRAKARLSCLLPISSLAMLPRGAPWKLCRFNIVSVHIHIRNRSDLQVSGCNCMLGVVATSSNHVWVTLSTASNPSPSTWLHPRVTCSPWRCAPKLFFRHLDLSGLRLSQ